MGGRVGGRVGKTDSEGFGGEKSKGKRNRDTHGQSTQAKLSASAYGSELLEIVNLTSRTEDARRRRWESECETREGGRWEARWRRREEGGASEHERGGKKRKKKKEKKTFFMTKKKAKKEKQKKTKKEEKKGKKESTPQLNSLSTLYNIPSRILHPTRARPSKGEHHHRRVVAYHLVPRDRGWRAVGVKGGGGWGKG